MLEQGDKTNSPLKWVVPSPDWEWATERGMNVPPPHPRQMPSVTPSSTSKTLALVGLAHSSLPSPVSRRWSSESPGGSHRASLPFPGSRRAARATQGAGEHSLHSLCPVTIFFKLSILIKYSIINTGIVTYTLIPDWAQNTSLDRFNETKKRAKKTKTQTRRQNRQFSRQTTLYL